MHVVIGILSFLVIMFGVLYVLEKSGKIKDENHNIIPDDIENVIKKAKQDINSFKQELSDIVTEVHQVADEVKQTKEAIKDILNSHKKGIKK